MGAHAFLAPSSAPRWVPCPGSVNQEMMHADDETDAQREGTAAHEVAAYLVERYTHNDTRPATKVGTTASNGVVITEEMQDAAEVYAWDVLQVMRSTGVFGGDALIIEGRLEMPQIHTLNWGTSDAVLYGATKGTLYVWDFKYGHLPVDPWENWQLIDYVAGALRHFKVDGYEDQHLMVDLRVVQPRCYDAKGPVRSWRVLAADLRAYFNTMAMAAEEACGPTPRLNTGSHCRNCRGRVTCPTFRKAAAVTMEWSESSGFDVLPPEAIGLELAHLKRAMDRLKYRHEAMQEEALQLIKRGQVVPGQRAQHKYGRLKWTAKPAEVFTLGDMMGVELRKPQEPITPTQAQRAGIDESVIKGYAERPNTGMELVPDDDNEAKKVFLP